jgi:RNA polymerase sigma-70 factor, ECF subfamily
LTDGGGKVSAARNLISGADKVARFVIGVSRKQPTDASVVIRNLNGETGLVGLIEDRPYFAMTFDIVGDRISALHVVRNPDSVRCKQPLTDS